MANQNPNDPRKAPAQTDPLGTPPAPAVPNTTDKSTAEKQADDQKQLDEQRERDTQREREASLPR